MKTVILTTFTNNVQAHMMQDILKEAGIDSILQGEMANQVLSPLANLGIQVLVFEDKFEQAKDILSKAFPEN
jgi:NADP-dependent alcohol dehydrogenase